MDGKVHKKSIFGEPSDLLVVVAMIAILAILFTPLSSIALDFLLISNLTIALLILLLTFYSDKPLSFSTFPSILLIATLFRLALNISATRLILDDGDAGRVIGAVGEHVVGGNYIVGVVVFVILIIVQYVVVTNGAQRVAEVAARFTLDSMPGKQMSIDADLNIGAIDEEQARARRDEIQQEANFYGAMDGATKFVKGDAIAGIIIIFIDIIAGLLVGVGQHGLSWGDSLSKYTLLTIGDGIVTQIPALVIATATGIIITRAATDSKLGSEVIGQITSHPSTLIIVSVILLLALFIPGLPSTPILLVLAIVLFAAFSSYRRAMEINNIEDDAEFDLDKDPKEEQNDIYKQLILSPIEIKVGSGLTEAIELHNDNLYERIKNIRKQFALELGLVIPKVKLITERTNLTAYDYSISIYGAQIGTGELRPNRTLAIIPNGNTIEIEGIKTKEPTYGLPAFWIESETESQARQHSYTLVEWDTVLITHFSELIRRHAHELLSRSEVERILERHKNSCAGLIEEIVPNLLSMTDIQRVLQALLKEQVSIRNIELILEELAEKSKAIKDPQELADQVRKRLGTHICQQLANKEGVLEVLTFEPGLERILITSVNSQERMSAFQIDPASLETVITSILKSAQKMMSKNSLPIILCSPAIRRRVKQVTERVLPKLAVVAINEVPVTVNVNSFDVIRANLPNKQLSIKND